MTSPSLLPSANFSRTWPRRSTASGARELAMVSFWHTRQRSFCDSSITRDSSSGSSATGSARSAANAEAASASAPASSRERKRSTRTGQLRDLRQQHLVQRLGIERADVLVADHAGAIDEKGFRCAVDAVFDGEATVGI